MDLAYLSEWANLLIRWLHVIAGIAWIGTSFYFIGLDNQLDPPRDGDPRVKGEQWSIHGGGFYHKRKFATAPAELPQTLHWFKWEAYWTWISGFALFVLIYWGSASTYLVDPAVLDLPPWLAVAISAVMLAGGWVVYDLICRSRFGQDERKLSAAMVGLLVLSAIIACHVFSGRGAFLQIGAMTGTIMVANVAMVIIPGQRRMVEAMRAGREPDPKYGAWGKQRSVHNTYLTLPVLFLMISPHYPMTWGAQWNWVVLLAITLAGALVRQYFVSRQLGRNPLWLPAAAAAVVVGLIYALQPAPRASLAGVAVPAMAEAAFRYDAEEEGSAEAWVAGTLARFGRIDAVGNAAGINPMARLLDADEAPHDTMWRVNVKGPMRVIRAAWPHLVASGEGRVVNLASLSGKRVANENIGYAMSKFALVALTQEVRRLGWDSGIRACAVCPGFVETDMTAGASWPRAQMSKPEDVAELVATVLRLPNTAVVGEIRVNCRHEALL
ncbi:urate hydroxylase PuuD [Leptolyngbya sp. 15MV]|nr:urate hydroxylase PuuD [Leptolyngbya sp. 15MV]